jgi:hypothetical protein
MPNAFRGECRAGEDECNRENAIGIAEAVGAGSADRAADEAKGVEVQRTCTDDAEHDEEPAPDLRRLAGDEARDAIERRDLRRRA